MAACKIKEKRSFIECDRPALEGDPEGLCLLHSRQADKDKEGRFTDAVKEKLAQEDYDFQMVFFPGDIDFFPFHKFKKDADFSRATFSGAAHFYGSTFSGAAYFSGVTFSRAADFSSATFSGLADFSGAIFSGWASFYRATFSVEALFTYAKFSGTASFSNATFSGWASFSNAIFSRATDFCGSTFSGDTVFSWSTFSGRTDFSSCHICNQLVLNSINLAENGESRKTLQAYFRHLRFANDGRLLFQDLSLAHPALTGTDLLQCRFNNVDWQPFRGRQAIYDEVLLYNNAKGQEGEKPSKEQYARVEESYRYLKLNYEAAGDFKKAGDFHYGEMEMHRRASKWRWFPFYWYNLYRFSSGYGERPLRAFIWLLLLIPAWAGLVWWLGIDQAGIQNPVNYWQTLLFIFEKATLQRPAWTDIAGINGVEKFLSGLSVLLLPGQAALFILALRNRLGRRR